MRSGGRGRLRGLAQCSDEPRRAVSWMDNDVTPEWPELGRAQNAGGGSTRQQLYRSTRLTARTTGPRYSSPPETVPPGLREAMSEPRELLVLAVTLAVFAVLALGPSLGLPFIGDDYVFLDKTRAASFASRCQGPIQFVPSHPRRSCG